MKRKRSRKRRLFTRRRLGLLLVAAVAVPLAYLAYEARVASAFVALDRSIPSRIIARPMILRTGDRLPAERARAYLERVGYEASPAPAPDAGRFRLRRGEWHIGRRPLRLGGFFDPGGLAVVRLDRYGRIRQIRDDEGRELPGLVLDPEVVGAALGPRGRDRVPVELSRLPDHLIEALLTVEDRRFREHGALDPRRIVGAALSNLRQGRVAEGGSTLTQQLARTLFLSTDRTVLRKLREIAIAVALERRFSKDRLLEAYLNHIYLGQDGRAAIHGVGRAAEFFFGVDATQLTVGQSATLVGIIRGPSVYSPHRHPDRARARRDLVLRQLHEQGHLDEARLAAELERPLVIREPPTRDVDARWYLDFLERELGAGRDGIELEGAGLTVVSSLDPAMQRAAERIVRGHLERLERAYPRLKREEGSLQAALVALDPWTGEILAMVGGRSYGASQFNRAADALRQPGSAFKPIVAAAALQRESGFTLASVLEDAPLTLETATGVWAPRNADRDFQGPIPLREALESSRNVPFARLGLAIGPERIVETARELGIRSSLRPVPSLALGASEVSLLELTGAYATLAAEGERHAPHAVRSVLDASGEAILDAPRDAERAVSAGEAYLLTSALRGVVERGTGAGVRDAGYHGPVAAKSGTTNGARDAWFVGYTPEVAVGVWVGFDDGSPTGLSGSRAALPIFSDFLASALGPGGGANFRFPEGVEWVDIEPETGRRAGWGCRGEPELFLIGTEPRERCGARGDRRWRELERRFGAEAIDEVERWLRRAAGSRRPVRIEGGGPGR